MLFGPPVERHNLRVAEMHPLDLTVASAAKQGEQNSERIRVTDDEGWRRTRRQSRQEGSHPGCDVSHRFPTSPSDLSDVFTGRSRLFDKLARQLTFQRSPVLFPKCRHQIDGGAETLGDDFGGLFGSHLVRRPNHLDSAFDKILRRFLSLGSTLAGQLGSHCLPQDSAAKIASGLPMPDQIQLHEMRLARATGLLAGLGIDALIADPPNAVHPTAWFGQWASWLEKRLYRDSVLAGLGYYAAALSPAIALGIGLDICGRRNPRIRLITTAVATWMAVGTKSLANEGESMATKLDWGDLAGARAQLPNLCGRKPNGLDEHALARATVESLAENTSDSTVASLFWGSFGITPMLIHRATNTLDAMVGSHSARYEKFGKAAARADDILGLIPARLTGVLAALAAPAVGGRVGKTAHIVLRDHAKHPSPNGGWPESAWASALDVQLGGRNVYQSGVEYRGLLNEGAPRPAGRACRQAARLVKVVSWVAGGLCAAVLMGWRRG